MDWFLYDNSIRHERVKLLNCMQLWLKWWKNKFSGNDQKFCISWIIYCTNNCQTNYPNSRAIQKATTISCIPNASCFLMINRHDHCMFKTLRRNHLLSLSSPGSHKTHKVFLLRKSSDLSFKPFYNYLEMWWTSVRG